MRLIRQEEKNLYIASIEIQTKSVYNENMK
jgi:hypothetical protein